jgi:hypothetical protein
MSRLTILIPDTTFNTALEQTLVSVLQNRPEYSEVIVATAQPYEDPYELGREVRFLCNASCETRLDLINYGCREARGDVVHLLLPGVLATDGWTDRVLHHFADKKVAAVAPMIVPSEEAARVIAMGISYTKSGSRCLVGAGTRIGDDQAVRHAVLAPTLSAGFFRRETLNALAGFDRELGESFADVELGLALRDLGLTTHVEPHSRVTTDHAIPLSPRTFQEARNAERLFQRHVDASMSRFGHTLLVATEILTGFPHARMITRLAGRLAARREMNPRSHYESRLDRAREALQAETRSTIRGAFASDERASYSRRSAA